MGVYIKGMEMPKDGVYWCEIGVAGDIATITIHGEERKSFPLVPVPEPHGRCYIVFYYLWNDSAEISGVFWTREDAERECDDLRSQGLNPWIEQYYIHGCTLTESSAITGKLIPCPSCGGILSEVREYNGIKYRHCYACHFEFEEK